MSGNRFSLDAGGGGIGGDDTNEESGQDPPQDSQADQPAADAEDATTGPVTPPGTSEGFVPPHELDVDPESDPATTDGTEPSTGDDTRDVRESTQQQTATTEEDLLPENARGGGPGSGPAPSPPADEPDSPAGDGSTGPVTPPGTDQGFVPPHELDVDPESDPATTDGTDASPDEDAGDRTTADTDAGDGVPGMDRTTAAIFSGRSFSGIEEGLEDEGGRIGEQARELEQRILGQSEGLSGREDVAIFRREVAGGPDVLFPEITRTGAAGLAEQQVAEQFLGFDADDFTATIEGADIRIDPATRQSEAAVQRQQAESALRQQFPDAFNIGVESVAIDAVGADVTTASGEQVSGVIPFDETALEQLTVDEQPAPEAAVPGTDEAAVTGTSQNGDRPPGVWGAIDDGEAPESVPDDRAQRNELFRDVRGGDPWSPDDTSHDPTQEPGTTAGSFIPGADLADQLIQDPTNVIGVVDDAEDEFIGAAGQDIIVQEQGDPIEADVMGLRTQFDPGDPFGAVEFLGRAEEPQDIGDAPVTIPEDVLGIGIPGGGRRLEDVLGEQSREFEAGREGLETDIESVIPGQAGEDLASLVGGGVSALNIPGAALGAKEAVETGAFLLGGEGTPGERVETVAGEVGPVALGIAQATEQDPFRVFGAGLVGVGSGFAAGRAIEALPSVARSARIRAGGGDIFDVDELSDPPTHTMGGQLPGFTERSVSDPDVALGEFRTQAGRGALAESIDDPVMFHGRAAEDVGEFGAFGRQFEAPGGGSEIPGMFFAADLSPLRLPGGGGTSLFGRPRLPRPRFRTARIAAERDPDLDVMPSSIRTLDEAADFMGQADPTARFIRSERLITPEQEAIAPPGAGFADAGGLFGVRAGGEVVPGRLFRAVDDPDVPRGAFDAGDVVLESAEAAQTLRRSTRRAEGPSEPFFPIGSPTFGQSFATAGPTGTPSEPFGGGASSTPGLSSAPTGTDPADIFSGPFSGSGTPVGSEPPLTGSDPMDLFTGTPTGPTGAVSEQPSVPASRPPSGPPTGPPSGVPSSPPSDPTTPADPTGFIPGIPTTPPTAPPSRPPSGPPSIFGTPTGPPSGPPGIRGAPPMPPTRTPFDPGDDRRDRDDDDRLLFIPLGEEFENPIASGMEFLFGRQADGPVSPFGDLGGQEEQTTDIMNPFAGGGQ